MSWHQSVFDPIELPDGRKLITLRDAALYITKLPKAEYDAEERQAAMQAFLLVAEHDGPTMFARIRVMRHKTATSSACFNPDRKDQHWGTPELARDGGQRPKSIVAAAILTALLERRPIIS